MSQVQETTVDEKAQAAAEAAAKKAAEKAAKAEEKARKDAEAKAAKERDAALKAEKKAAEKAEREAKKAQEKADKEAKNTQKMAAREANRMPEQNGVRRPKPDTETGKVWKLADDLSAQFGQPTPIANLLDVGQKQGLNDSTIRTQYARWRTFHGIAGRVSLPTPAAAPANADATETPAQ